MCDLGNLGQVALLDGKVEKRDGQMLTVDDGQTLGDLFEQAGIPASTMHKLLDATSERRALVRLRPGTVIGFDIPADGQLRALRFDRDDTHRVLLSLAGDKVDEQVIERPTTIRTVLPA